MNGIATVLFPFFLQLSVNRTYFASAYENLSSSFYIERTGEGKFSVMLTNNLFHRLQSVYLQRKLAHLCVYMTRMLIPKPPLNKLMIIFWLQVKKIRVFLKIGASSLLKNFAVATRRWDNAMKHLYDI